jgi:four helix bundle protein
MVKRLEDLRVYISAEEIADKAWSICEKWPVFAKRTVGGQFVRAADSIGANVAEGYGRYHYKENMNFCFYARGSLEETKCWLRRALKRKLVSEEAFHELNTMLNDLLPQLNAYIRSIGKRASTNDRNSSSVNSHQSLGGVVGH